MLILLKWTNDGVRCEICNEILDRSMCPKYWWEKIGIYEDPENLKAVCQVCGDKLEPEEKEMRLEGFQRHYWKIRDGIFTRDNFIMTFVAMGIIIIAVVVGILFFGGFFPSDFGY